MSINRIQFLIVILITIFSLSQCKPKKQQSAPIKGGLTELNEISFDFSKKNKTLISAHRGGKNIAHYPENCLETLDYLFKKGIQIFEIDISQTKDNQLILMHDNSLQRTSTGRQDVDQVSLEKIKTYNLVDYKRRETSYKVPTFKEVLYWISDKQAYLMVDIKKDVSYRNLIKEIRETKTENKVILISYSVKQASKLNIMAPEMLLAVPMRNEREVNEMLNSCISTNKMVAFTGTILSDSSLYHKIHQHNIMTILGTLGNLDNNAKRKGDAVYKKYEQMGIDIFATDRPLQVQNAIN